MKRISFNSRFINTAGDNLVLSKIHTIRQNYEYWKTFEGKDVALFVWENKPYHSKQKVFCTKKIINVQKINLIFWDEVMGFSNEEGTTISNRLLSKNDGFSNLVEYFDWFLGYKPREMAILHFTDFRY